MRHQSAKKNHDAMNKKSTIYVLFKECPEVGTSKPYICASADYINFPEELMRDWTAIFDVLNYFGYEDAHKYYDEDNFEGLIGVARTFQDEYPSVETTIISGSQAIGLTSWKTAPAVRTDSYCLGNDDVTNDLLGDMAQRELDHRNTLYRVRRGVNNFLTPQEKEYEPCVLLQQGAVVALGDMLRITMPGNRTLDLECVKDIAELHKWFSLHRFPYRHYQFNAKHGDANHPSRYYSDRHGNSIKAAQLLTGTGQTRALLKQAVGESYDGDLWYYDHARACFIYFENQGNTPQHEYHAYHLHLGENNYEKIDIEKLRKVQANIP